MTALLLCVLGGDCRVVRQVQTASIVQQTAVVPVTFPAFIYSAGDFDRLRKLEMIAEQNQLLIQQQAQLVSQLVAERPATAQSKLDLEVKSIVEANCIKCHSGDKPKGNFSMTGTINTAQKLLMVNMVEMGEMPPKPAAKLSDEDFNTLRAWSLADKKGVREFLRGK